MDLLKSFSGGGHGNDDNEKPPKTTPAATTTPGHEKHSTTEVLGDAKTVAEAAKRAATEGVDKVDKAKAAAAAEDLVEAAEDYGNLSGTGYAKYVDQAKDYLHKYEADNKNSNDSSVKGPTKPVEEEKKKSEEGGVGGYLKMAQGFMK